MAESRVELVIGADGAAAGFELRLGDRRIQFGIEEASSLAVTWPGKLGAIAAIQAGSGQDRLEVELGGQTVSLSAAEARQLAGLPSQLLWLLALAEVMSDAPERVR